MNKPSLSEEGPRSWEELNLRMGEVEVLGTPNSETAQDGSGLDIDEYKFPARSKARSCVGYCESNNESTHIGVKIDEGMLTKVDEAAQSSSPFEDRKCLAASDVEVRVENEVNQSERSSVCPDESIIRAFASHRYSKAKVHERLLLAMNKKLENLAVWIALKSLNNL